MFGRIILTALAAGLISGVFVWGAHMVKTIPLILAAEIYEDQAVIEGTTRKIILKPPTLIKSQFFIQISWH